MLKYLGVYVRHERQGFLACQRHYKQTCNGPHCYDYGHFKCLTCGRTLRHNSASWMSHGTLVTISPKCCGSTKVKQEPV